MEECRNVLVVMYFWENSYHLRNISSATGYIAAGIIIHMENDVNEFELIWTEKMVLATRE